MRGRADKEKEYEKLFKANYSRLFYCALDWLEDTEAAKDIVSDVFGELWKQYDRLYGQPALSAYLLRSVRNRCVNYLKHQTVEQQYRQSLLAQKEETIDEDAALHEENLQRIEQVLDGFTPQTRLIFEQCYFEGRTYQEVADRLEVSVSAIHKHMNKAFNAFRREFLPKKATEER